VAALAFTSSGPGRFSLDHRLGTTRSGPGMAAGQLALGLAGAAAIIRGFGDDASRPTREPREG
jgi:hypothetical protein